MIIPSIDIMNGQAVQLEQGKTLKVTAGDPFVVAKQFSYAGEIAVIDLDAAMGTGDNRALIERLMQHYPCRVGGGIRDVDTAVRMLDRGAKKIIIGSRATPEFLRELPKYRVIAALDCFLDEVMVHGWKTATGKNVYDEIRALSPYVSGFLITFIENEGLMGGVDVKRVEKIIEAAANVPVTIAGGVTTPADIAAVDRAGADAQVGMALYRGRLDLADAIIAPIVSDRNDGLIPTVVVDEQGILLGLAYSNRESVRSSIEKGFAVYQSRKRGLWEKGATSGAHQRLIRIDGDCDRDTLRFVVKQEGNGFCHRQQWTCFDDGYPLGQLMRRLRERMKNAPSDSYTQKLFNDPTLLNAKLVEEARELTETLDAQSTVHEACDVIFFALTKCAKFGITLTDLEREFDRRSLQIVRRGGFPK